MGVTVCILGASGDLTFRYLLPALAELSAAGQLPADAAVIGVARDAWSDEQFRDEAGDRLERHAPGVPAAARRRLVERLSYRPADVAKPESLASALGAVPVAAPFVAYLALPPRLFAPAVEALTAWGLPPESRLVVEKPFGEDLESARSLNDTLRRAVPERALFRMDHFLGMQTVQNILGLRFANRLFEPLWNHHHVERVEVVWDETLALEGRAGYYDHTGALVDMIQNHLLQLLCLVAMEPPATFSEQDLRDRKVEVLRAVRRPGRDAAARHSRRARYGAGKVAGRAHPAYVDEAGVDPERGTETFAELMLFVDNWRWSGTPFTLRTGKALAEDRRCIDVYFRPVPHPAFGQPEPPSQNRLRLEVDPDRLALRVDINGPGDPFDLESVELCYPLAPQELSAYARLLLAVIAGDPVLSIRGDEAEECWRIVEPVLEAWRAEAVPLLEYPAGSSGPDQATARERAAEPSR